MPERLVDGSSASTTSSDVVVGVRGRERQREELVARALGHREGRLVGEALAVPAQPVHGQEVDRGRDPLLGERGCSRRGSRPRARGRSGRCRGGARACPAGRARSARGRRARRAPRRRARTGAARRGVLELVELDERDRGEDVGEVRLVAGNREVVARRRGRAASGAGCGPPRRRRRRSSRAARPRRRRRSSSRRGEKQVASERPPSLRPR